MMFFSSNIASLLQKSTEHNKSEQARKFASLDVIMILLSYLLLLLLLLLSMFS